MSSDQQSSDIALIDATSSEEMDDQYLTFYVGREVFGVAILAIKEILEYCPSTAIPMVPKYIHGVINLRGQVLPIIDLSERLSIEGGEIGRRSCYVIAEVAFEDEKYDIGILIDSVNEVIDIPKSEIEPAPSFGAEIRADFIKGMGKVRDNFVILLNVDKVLSIDELAILGDAGNHSQKEGVGLPEVER